MEVIVTRNSEKGMPESMVNPEIVLLLIQTLLKEENPNKQKSRSPEHHPIVILGQSQAPIDIIDHPHHKKPHNGQNGIAQIPGILFLGQYGHNQGTIHESHLLEVARDVHRIDAKRANGEYIIQPMPLEILQIDHTVEDLPEVVEEAARGAEQEDHSAEGLTVPEAVQDQRNAGEVRARRDQHLHQ